jgi:AcrR family transcriptional regulator
VTIDDTEEGPRRGRPRNEAIDEAAIAAALDLLVEGGVRAVTVEAVARRAATSPPAIYRRWPNVEDLLWAAMRSVALAAAKRTHGGPPYSTDDLPFDQALRQTMRRSAEIFGDRRLAASYLAVATAAQSDPAMKAGFERFQAALNEPMLALVQSAAEAAGLPARTVANLVTGAVIYPMAIKGVAPTPEEMDAVAGLIIAGCRALARERGLPPP